MEIFTPKTARLKPEIAKAALANVALRGALMCLFHIKDSRTITKWLQTNNPTLTRADALDLIGFFLEVEQTHLIEP